jgi:hypothetical protein
MCAGNGLEDVDKRIGAFQSSFIFFFNFSRLLPLLEFAIFAGKKRSLEVES